MKFSTEERIKLVLEAILVSFLTLLIIIALFQIIILGLEILPEAILEWPIIEEIMDSTSQPQSLFFQIFVTILVLLVIALVVFWRLYRRKRRFELNHIIEGLVYISQGNYEYRIQGVYSDDMKEVVNNIHMMVDHTVETLEEERRMEESKDELISNVSHDLRTPLTSILGYLALIETNQFKSEEEARKYVSIAYQKALQMQSLVNDLFEYSQVSQSSNAISMVNFDLVQLMEQLVAEFEWQASQAEMAIEFECQQESIIMKADPEKLVRVFTNIIANALKYGSDGNLIKIEMAARSPQVYIRISNNGEPIPQRSLGHIFERFYQDEKSRTDQKGSGLGLAISKSIVDQHGGHISAYVTEGWTHFVISLPIRATMDAESTL